MKKDYFWNTVAGFINAAEAVVISIIVTRVTGLTESGYFTIAFAVGNLLMTVGKFGVYNYQVTDKNTEFTYLDYVYTRVITCFIMLLCLIGYMAYGSTALHNNIDKSGIILGIGIIYLIESFEDVLKARCQIEGKLYAGAILFSVRWVCIIIVFTISLVLSRKAMIAIIVSMVISLAVFVIGRFIIYRTVIHSFEIKNRKVASFRCVISIIRKCFPLFVSTFLLFYVSNSPKYAIDRYYSSDVQACFGFVAMPVFVIELLSSFIYNPQLVIMTEEYGKSDKSAFKKRIRKQILTIAALSAVCTGGAYVIGIPVLSLIYNTDLTAYKGELIIMVIAGGLLAVSAYQSIIMTIMRVQKLIMWGYVPIALFCAIVIYPVTKRFGTAGAAITYLISMGLLCVIYFLMIMNKQAMIHNA